MFWAQVQSNYAQFAISRFSITPCLKYLSILFWMRITDVGESNSWLLSFGDQGCPWSFRAIFATGRAVVTATQPQNHLLPAARSAKRSAPEVQLIEYVSFMFLTPTHAIHSMCYTFKFNTQHFFRLHYPHLPSTQRQRESDRERERPGFPCSASLLIIAYTSLNDIWMRRMKICKWVAAKGSSVLQPRRPAAYWLRVEWKFQHLATPK